MIFLQLDRSKRKIEEICKRFQESPWFLKSIMFDYSDEKARADKQALNHNGIKFMIKAY